MLYKKDRSPQLFEPRASVFFMEWFHKYIAKNREQVKRISLLRNQQYRLQKDLR